MNNEYIISLIKEGKRVDGRGLDDFREVSLEYNISKNAEGSAKCKIGETEVIVGVKMNVGEPYSDSPDEGVITVTAELSPVASPLFELGPPNSWATELARVVDRGIRESKCIDFKKLCIRENEKVWMIFLDIYPINDDGNLIDASVLAALAALKSVRIPRLENDKVIFGELTNEKLKLNKTPITFTFGKVEDKIILDPNSKEESILNARVSISVYEGNIHAMQKGGDDGIEIGDVEKMVDIAIKKEKELRSLLK